MSSHEAVVRDIVERLKSVHPEFAIVDISMYPSVVFSGPGSEIVIIAGHIPNLAAVFTIQAHLKGGPNFEFSSFNFRIDGEVDRNRMSDDNFHFNLVPRRAVGHESYGGAGNFMINTEPRHHHKSVDDQVAEGIGFFKSFVDNYGHFLRNKFTRSIHLWFIPEYCDEMERLEAANGRYNSENYVPFNKKVLDKFPRGFFHESQMP